MSVQKNMGLTKIEPEVIDAILEKYQAGDKHFFETIKFIYNLREKKDFKTITSMSPEATVMVVIKYAWIAIKYYIIAKELILARGKMVHNLFDKYYLGLSREEIDELIKSTSNVWLEAEPAKINVLKDYCMELLSDTYFRKDICTKGISVEEYERIQKDFKKKINEEIELYVRINNAFEERKKYTLNTHEETDAYKSMEMYRMTFDEGTLLEQEGKVDD